MAEAGIIKSKSEGRRLIQQNGVRVDGETIEDVNFTLAPGGKKEQVVQVGKRKFLRVLDPN